MAIINNNSNNNIMHLQGDQWGGLIACQGDAESPDQWFGVALWHSNASSCSHATEHPLLSDNVLLSLRLGMGESSIALRRLSW